MEDHRPYKILFSLFLVLLPFAYTSQEQYFINCGSSSTITVNGRNFVGDANSSSFSFLHRGSSVINNPNPSTDSSPLYETARIFRQASWYELDIGRNGTYLVRFHFSAFASQDNLSAARFNVSASGFSLLSNFGVQNRNNSPIIEEFLFTVDQGKFRIYFTPESSSMAFINAIEAFVDPSSPRPLIPDSAAHIAPTGRSNKDYQGLLSNALHVIYRINVGGPKVTPDNDKLWRNWVPDDDFLFLRDAAKNTTQIRSERPNYQNGFATPYDAPDPVYNTAKELNTSFSSPLFNISWRFSVNRTDRFLVRAHFCDVVSQASSIFIKFNLYLYSSFSYLIDPRDGINQLAVPFYRDFVVDSDDSGFMNISVGPRPDSENQTAFLNGLEIMKLVNTIPKASAATKKQQFVIIGSVIGGFVFVIILMAMLLFMRWKNAKPVETSEMPLMPVNRGSSYGPMERNVHGSPLQDLNLGLKVPFADVLFATNDFDDKLIIGKGGFGKVYKGTLRDGTKVAVKRSEPGRRQGLPEFQTEITILSKIRHRHLVSLIGYCDERSEMVLVYEFMERGSLRDHLYNFSGESGKPIIQAGLSWDKRLELCIGAAKGLHYLHTGLNGAIIHRDVKSTNILLDGQYVAKVADFGISRSGPLDQTHISTEVKGSLGYLDPEYYKFLQLTQKSDVFSFGVVLLEVLAARAAIDNLLPREQVNLADWGMSCIMKGELEKLVDPLLVGKINSSSLRKFGETVEKCLQERGIDRPNMVDVLWDLEYALQLQHTPVPRQPHEDSTTDVTWGLSLPGIHRLPSHIIPMSEDEILSNDSGTSCSKASQVFSQLKMDEAR